MITKIFDSYEDFKNREDKEVNGVSKEFAEKNPNWESDNKSNKGCWNCKDCWNCYYCENCYFCRSCTATKDYYNGRGL